MIGQGLTPALERQHDRRVGVVQHQRQALLGIGRIQWQESSAGFENGQNRDHHLRAVLHANGHRHVRPDPERLQLMGQAIGAGVELRVGQLLFFELDGHAVRRPLDLVLEHLVEAPVFAVIGLGVVEFDQELSAFGSGQNVQIADRCGRIADDALQQRMKMTRHPGDGGGVEQVGVVADGGGERSGRLDDQHHQVKRGGPAFQRN